MKIVIMEPLGMCACTAETGCRELKAAGHEVVFHTTRSEQEDVLIERAKGAEVIVISNIPLGKRFFENCPGLKMISVAFTGVDHIDLGECRQRNITVCNAAGYSTQAVAELTIGMMIDVCRKMTGGDAVTRAGGDRQNFLGTELGGKTVGIIGLGAIGQKVANLALAFGCRVMAFNRTPRPVAGIELTDKISLLQKSDIISVHIPLTPDTRDFIGENDFLLMQPHAVVINTARGPIINEQALCDALKKGRIAGAALDVYAQEPPLPSGSELLKAPNLLLLPHMGYATKEAFSVRFDIVMENIRMWLNGTPRNLIKIS